jgi:uncharacterized protein YfaS (alpha-2-macroglobulin family)
MVIGDLVLVKQRRGTELDLDVLSGSTGRPVPGVTVRLFERDYRTGHREVAKKVSDRNGSLHFSGKTSHSYFLVAQKGTQLAVDDKYLYLYGQREAKETFASLIYTDRSIYRPLQTIRFKAVAYRGRQQQADFKTAPKAKLEISLLDGNSQVVAKKPLVTNEYGTASGEFDIPGGKLLGRWQLRSSIGGTAYLRVEEYKRPTFETKLVDPKTPMRLNTKTTLIGSARYYFGLPVSSGTVRWRVTRTPVYPYWWWWYYGGYSSSSQTIDAGTSSIEPDGRYRISFVPQADARLAKQSKDLSYRYAVSAEATDEGGETRSTSRSFNLGFVAVSARMQIDTGFVAEGRPSKLSITRTNLDGIPLAGKGQYRIVALPGPRRTLLPAAQPLMKRPEQAPNPYATPGDQERPRWQPSYNTSMVLHSWVDGKEQAQGDLTHGDTGQAAVNVPALHAGAYRLHYTTKDAFGAEFKLAQEFIVAGKRTKVALPSYLQTERNSVPVGQTARVLAVSGLTDQPMILDLYRSGKRVQRRVLRSGSSSTLLEFPITEKDRGGFGLSLYVLRDHQWMHSSQSIYVPWDNKQLDVSFATFRDKLRPGAKETWRVKITGPAGKKTPVKTAELLAYMYDRSLDTFAPHNPPTPWSVFPYRTQTTWPEPNLGQASRSWLRSDGFGGLPSWPHLYGDQVQYFSSYGVGGVGYRGGYDYGRGSYHARQSVRRAVASPAPMEAKDSPKKKTDSLVANGRASRFDDTPAAEAPASGKDRDEQRAPGSGQATTQLRTNFSETAFWQPHLLTDAGGAAVIEFVVPDSVTAWNVWVHAVTRDLQSGAQMKQAKTVKELMVRPYLTRFLREGDKAELKVVVNNASDKTLEGKLDFDIVDPESKRSLLQSFGVARRDATERPFSVKPQGGTNLSFPITTPAKVGLIAFRVTATSGNFSDGELRPIPILPGRMHLAQSRFVTLKDKDQRKLHFADLARNDDPTRITEQMVITLDTQLFYSVLSALPYLVDYPYECTEQTLNRFVSTGILASMYKDYPAIARMAQKFSSRKTQLESFDAPDPNRKMALEETPWLQQAQGGVKQKHPLLNVLDPRIAHAQRDVSLAKLQKAQTSLGGFPWFSGGPPSPYMTLYLLHGFSKALEFGVDLPKPMIQRAWSYMHRHYIDELIKIMMSLDCCWEFITFLNYTLSNYPDTSWSGNVFTKAEREKMLSFSFAHWKRHSPYLKGYLALTLKRMGRAKDAILVWESVMDSAKTKQDQGTFWAAEDRAWLWYNDTIETHAFAIRTVMELTPKEKKLDGLVLWIFLNKKLNHWKSTRATAEVIYSLAHYLKQTAQLGLREEISVSAGDVQQKMVFLPDEYTGKKNQIVIPGERVDPKKTSTIVVEKATKGFAMASATWHFSTAELPRKSSGDYLSVNRRYFLRVKTGKEIILKPLAEGTRIAVGDEVEVHLSLRTKHPMEYVHLRDPRPAGFEPVSTTSRHQWSLGIYWYEEIRDSGTNFFFERLPQGEYPFKYRLTATVAGTFKASPATVQPMYAPEFTGYSAGATITIDPAQKR